MENQRLVPTKIQQLLDEAGLTQKDFTTFSRSTFHRVRTGEPVRAVVLHDVAVKLGLSVQELVELAGVADPRRVVVFRDWQRPDELRLPDLVRCVREGADIQVEWPDSARVALSTASLLATELTGLSACRPGVAQLTREDRRLKAAFLTEAIEISRGMMDRAPGAVQEIVMGMKAHFGDGTLVASTTVGVLLQLVVVRAVTDVLVHTRGLLTHDEITALEGAGVPDWAHEAGNRFAVFARAFEVSEPVVVQITELGDHFGTVDVYSSLEDARRVRACGVGRRTVPLSWVSERAIPHVALQRLLDGETGELDLTEELHVNKIKHPDGREG